MMPQLAGLEEVYISIKLAFASPIAFQRAHRDVAIQYRFIRGVHETYREQAERLPPSPSFASTETVLIIKRVNTRWVAVRSSARLCENPRRAKRQRSKIAYTAF
jgi:hypothetical protein